MRTTNHMKHGFTITLIILGLLTGCTQGRLNYPATHANNNCLNPMIQLAEGDTVFDLKTFVTNPDQIDSVVPSESYFKASINYRDGKLHLKVGKQACGIADLKIYEKGIPFSIPCAFSNSPTLGAIQLSATDSIPRITTNKYNLATVTLHSLNGSSKAIAYWQNYLLPPALCLVQPKQILIAIPEEATAIARSYIRVWTSNRHGISNPLVVRLEYGKPVIESTQLIKDDIALQQTVVDKFRSVFFQFAPQNTADDPITESLLITKISNRLRQIAPKDPLFLFGDTYVLQKSNATTVFAQKYFDRETLVFINNGPKDQEIKLTLPEIFISKTFKAMWGTKFDFDEKTITLQLKPYQAEFLNRHDSN